MSKIIEEVRKEDFIRDSMIKIIKGSEAVAVQAVDSTRAILKTGLASAEELSAMAGDLLLNTTRRAINAGSIIGGDLRDVTESVVKGTVRSASEIGGEVKHSVSKAKAGKSGEEAKEE